MKGRERMETLDDILRKLASNGGVIVSSLRCGSFEIDDAQDENRMIVTEDGYGLIWQPEGHIPRTAPRRPRLELVG